MQYNSNFTLQIHLIVNICLVWFSLLVQSNQLDWNIWTKASYVQKDSILFFLLDVDMNCSRVL